MISILPIAFASGILVISAVGFSKVRAASRAEYIRTYSFPIGLYDKLRKKRPELSRKDCELIGNALRQFFLAHLKSGRRFVSMPSQATDDLWHELILYTKSYEQFCRKAFGRFMHHTPAVILGSVKSSNSGLRRCWWYTCKEENINPRKPTRLPLLFAIDSKLGIKDGFRYVPDCKGFRDVQDMSAGVIYCGADFGDATFDGSTEGFGDFPGESSGTHSGDSGGADSSCGGDGCGGGGCGGGD